MPTPLKVGDLVWVRDGDDRGGAANERTRWSGPYTVERVGRKWATLTDDKPWQPRRVRWDDGPCDSHRGEYGPRSSALSLAEVEQRVWDAQHGHKLLRFIERLSLAERIAIAREVGFGPLPPDDTATPAAHPDLAR